MEREGMITQYDKSARNMTVRITKKHIHFNEDAARYVSAFPSVQLIIQPEGNSLLFVKGDAVKPVSVKREKGAALLDDEGRLGGTAFLARLFVHMKWNPSNEYTASGKPVYLKAHDRMALEVDLNTALSADALPEHEKSEKSSIHSLWG